MRRKRNGGGGGVEEEEEEESREEEGRGEGGEWEGEGSGRAGKLPTQTFPGQVFSLQVLLHLSLILHLETTFSSA